MTVNLTELERTFTISTNFVTMQENIAGDSSTTGSTSSGTSTIPSSATSTGGTTSATLTNELIILGSGEIGSKIKSDITQLYDKNGIGKLTYQWYVGGKAVANATKSTYTVAKVDYDNTIQLKVSYTDINFKTIVKESNIIISIHGSYVNDIVEFKLGWETTFIPKTLSTYNTTLEKIDGVLLFYDYTGNCIKQLLISDSNCNTSKTSFTFKGTLPDHPDTKNNNITSNIITYQVDFTKLDAKYKKVVYCVCEVATPPNVSIKPEDLYSKELWDSKANLAKNVSVLGTVSPFKTMFNKTGVIVLDINTLGTVKYPKSILKSGDEKRLHSATADSKERLCVFGVFTRSPDNNGWYYEAKYKVKTQLAGVKPLDYLKTSSKFTDLGL